MHFFYFFTFLVSQGVIREVYQNLNHTYTFQNLKSRLSFNPDGYNMLQIFDAPINVGDWYGQRIRGWFSAPLNGNYTFYASCDNFCELHISEDNSPAFLNMVIQQDHYSCHNCFFK